jgi:hypothetical protein
MGTHRIVEATARCLVCGRQRELIEDTGFACGRNDTEIDVLHIVAQAMSARQGQDPQGLEAKPASAVLEEDAPQPSEKAHPPHE